MKTTMLKNRKFRTALLGATGAIALCTQQAFAFGAMGGGLGGHVGGIGSGRLGSVGSRAGAQTPGAITMNGITVLPNGSMLVPAVTPRVPGVTPAAPQLNQLNTPPSPGTCAAPYCEP
jgi:hypothetical protein